MPTLDSESGLSRAQQHEVDNKRNGIKYQILIPRFVWGKRIMFASSLHEVATPLVWIDTSVQL